MDDQQQLEALATSLEASSARWLAAIEEADNDTDRGYFQGRSDAAEQAAIRVRAILRKTR
jgi:hypothetical protein